MSVVMGGLLLARHVVLVITQSFQGVKQKFRAHRSSVRAIEFERYVSPARCKTL